MSGGRHEGEGRVCHSPGALNARLGIPSKRRTGWLFKFSWSGRRFTSVCPFCSPKDPAQGLGVLGSCSGRDRVRGSGFQVWEEADGAGRGEEGEGGREERGPGVLRALPLGPGKAPVLTAHRTDRCRPSQPPSRSVSAATTPPCWECGSTAFSC